MAVNIAGVVKNIKQVSAYTPIIESIVNAIESIILSKRTDGKVSIKIIRDGQLELLGENALPPVRSIIVTDNGVGFNKENLDSFDTLYSEYKLNTGGKGFGRFTYLKFFSKVYIESVFNSNGKYYLRKFALGRSQKIVEKLETKPVSTSDTTTSIYLTGLYDEYIDRYDKNIDTIAKRLVNSLLIYFISSDFKCPTITISEQDGTDEITLNEFVENDDSIKAVASTQFEIEQNSVKNKFEVKIYKIYSANSQTSNVILCGHNREVTSTPLHSYVPEFKDEFYEVIETKSNENSKRNYNIRVYVISKYLDDNVSLERSRFEIPKKKSVDNLLGEISQEEIETKAVDITKQQFNEDVTLRQQKKIEQVHKYVSLEAPWYGVYLKEIDYDQIPYNATNPEIDTALNKVRYKYETAVKTKVADLLKKDTDFNQNINEIVANLNEISKTDLAHYVVLRKSVIDIFRKSLQINSDNNYDLEKVLHNIIFPLNANSTNTEYKDHNLWIIDERLSFHEYISSDEKLPITKDRPDIVIFDKKILVRNDNELSNPLFIFEFKRPQREDYTEKDDPIKQINRYVEQIRSGNFKAKDGRNIMANPNTPAYGFVICDLTQKIKEFCKDAQLTLSSDQQAYYGYHSSYQIYFEIISFDKLIKDSELRNRIFFKKLGIA